MCPWFDGNWIGGWWLTGKISIMLFMLLFWGVILWGIFILGRKFLNNPQHSSVIAIPHSPIDILKERYAKGELTLNEFEQMKKDIKDI